MLHRWYFYIFGVTSQSELLHYYVQITRDVNVCVPATSSVPSQRVRVARMPPGSDAGRKPFLFFTIAEEESPAAHTIPCPHFVRRQHLSGWHTDEWTSAKWACGLYCVLLQTLYRLIHFFFLFKRNRMAMEPHDLFAFCDAGEMVIAVESRDHHRFPPVVEHTLLK